MAANTGDTVRVHYTGKLRDGTAFDSSREGEPLEFTVGEGEILEGVDDAIVGMEPGETKKVEIEAENAYGDHRPELVQEIPREQIPEHVDLSVGARLEARNTAGQPLVVTVVDVDDQKATLDANHPLAGHDLEFELELVEVVGNAS